MTIRIITYDGQNILCDCNSFEFRTNQVSNWIKIKKGEATDIIHGVATIKSDLEEQQEREQNKCACYYCKHFHIPGWSYCKLHEGALGDSKCWDYEDRRGE